VRSRDTLARVGGDEFTLILENCALDKAIEICDSLISALQEYSFRWGERTFRVGVSIGVVLITLATSDATQAMTQADVACYTAKDLGRNRIYVYSSDDGKPTMRHAEIHRAAELREALDRGDFHLFQQAIYPVAASPRVAVEYEILIRMKDRMGKMIPPGAFIPAAERFSLMEGIDRWVIETAFRWFSETRHENPLTGIAINLSGASLGNNTLLDFIRHQMEAFSIPGARLCFEITETAAINNLTDAVHLITELKQQGCRFALDDFGSGLSSFNYIKTIPVDYLKIDGSLVRDIAEDPVDRAMVTAINQVGKAMGVQTIAEWVETEAVVAVLTDIGVDYMQGYLLGEPKPIR
jgi:EAL domain-containing protein (putative c-di-GMP-specific phosphodiesterase class I)